MAQDIRTRFIFIVVVTVIFAYILAPIPEKPAIPLLGDAKINLGIDLAGGAELRYRVLYAPGEANKEHKTRMATDIIRRRIEQKRLKEPKITPQDDDQINIQLAGVDRDGLNDYRRLIEQAGKLELYAAAPKDIQERFNRDGVVPEGFEAWKNDQPMSGEYEHFGTDRILLRKTPIIEGGHIATASHEQRYEIGGFEWVVAFELTPDGEKLFDAAAERLFHEKPRGLIAIVLDGQILSKPVVQTPAFRGRGQITGGWRGLDGEAGARNLAIVLRSGSLPAPIGLESESFVGPSLGEDSIRRGMLASSLTLTLVSLFMIFYYRTSGFIAVLSLFLNLLFLLGIMAFFSATLTLPGIAGIVLTVGMAVDANILIFERIREEQAKGKTASQAFEAGYERAFRAIVDANVTTLIVAVVLYYFGTGPVQGFAVTLSIGIATTLFSVLFCARTFQRMQIAGGVTEFRMLRLFSNPSLNYLRVSRPLILASAALVVGGVIFFGARGERNFGIDFRGGSMVQFSVREPQDIDLIRRRLQTFAPEGTARYADAEVQSVAPPRAEAAMGLRGRTSETFQVRTRQTDILSFKDDIQEIFKDLLTHEPFREMRPEEVTDNPRAIAGGPAGPGWWIYLNEEGYDFAEVRAKVAAALDPMVEKDARGQPAFLLEEAPEQAPPRLRLLKLQFTARDAEAQGGDLRRRAREAIKQALGPQLSPDPFSAQATIGPAVARELKDSTIRAMIASWFLMIVYVAVRFASWRYGVAAVVALIHDATVAIAFTSLAGALVPAAWGLNFDMNLTTMAAILTIIGYSINDTIVIFDRVRENLILMKKNTFGEIINASVNQTMSRTVLTSLTLWISAAVLYAFTMNTGGGIAEFAFPLLIGVIAGTYSTIWIASPIVFWWFRGQKPPTA